MKIYLKWLIINGLFGWLFLYSHHIQDERLMGVSIFFAWVVSILAWFVLSDKLYEKRLEKYIQGEKFVNKNLDFSYDLLMLIALVYYGYFWLGGFYLLHALFLHGFKDRIEQEAKK